MLCAVLCRLRGSLSVSPPCIIHLLLQQQAVAYQSTFQNVLEAKWKPQDLFVCLHVCLQLLGIRPRTWHVLGKCSVPELHPSDCCDTSSFDMGFCTYWQYSIEARRFFVIPGTIKRSHLTFQTLQWARSGTGALFISEKCGQRNPDLRVRRPEPSAAHRYKEWWGRSLSATFVGLHGNSWTLCLDSSAHLQW